MGHAFLELAGGRRLRGFPVLHDRVLVEVEEVSDAGVGLLARKQLEEDAPEAVDIALFVELLFSDDLGRAVLAIKRCFRGRDLAHGLADSGRAVVAHPDARQVCAEQDIQRLDVSVVNLA